jgi:hypothetical protein
MWSSCIICKHGRICDSCWKDDRETCGTCVNNIIEEDRDYAEEEEQRVVDLLGEEDSISGNLESLVAEYNTATRSPDLDNSLFALEAAINGGSGIVAREDAVYNVQLTNSNSSSTINTTGDNIRVGTAGGTTVESNTSRVNLAVQKLNAAKDNKKKKMKKKEPTLVSSTSASSTVLVQQSLHTVPLLTLDTLVRVPFPNQPTVVISKSNSAAHVVDRALGIRSSDSDPVEEEDESGSVVDLVQPRKRRKTSWKGVEKVHIDKLQISVDFIPEIIDRNTIRISNSQAHNRIVHNREERITKSGFHVKLDKSIKLLSNELLREFIFPINSEPVRMKSKCLFHSPLKLPMVVSIL